METNKEPYMVKSYRSYIQTLGVISLGGLILVGILFLSVLKDYFLWVFPIVILYFFLLNALQHFFLLSSSVTNPRVFQTNYLMWFGVKLFLNLTFVLIYILVDKSHALSFVMFFGVCYIFYTVFEVVSLSKILKKTDVK